MNLKLPRKLLLSAAAILLGASAAMAVPAKPGVVEYRMSDGSTVSVTIHGDEFSSYYMTSDGYVLLPDSRGDLCYATLKGSDIALSTVKAATRSGRTIADTRFIESIDRTGVLQAMTQRDSQTRSAARAARRAAQNEAKEVELITSYPTIGSPSALILLVEFADVHFQTPNPQESFNQLINQKGYSHNGATGSALDYYIDNSHGLFTPDFQVYGPVRLDNNESHYGAQEGQSYDRQAWSMVTEGCRKLHEQHPELDFSQFDNDGDGFVDNVFVFYAGYGQNNGAPAWTIWPHAANVYTYYGCKEEYNGVLLGNYACTNELLGTSGTVRTGIGTFVHEFNHILGLPDLYSTNNSGAFTPGTYEVMDQGPYNNSGNTPPYMCAYDRQSVGWLKVRELSGPETVTLNSINSNEALRINTEKKEEYFLLENRQKTGWDSHIEGHGMLVWHIDYEPSAWANNSVNNNKSHMYVDIVEADNVPTAATRSGDPFPGTTFVTSFTSTSVPAMRTWIGVDPNMPLTDIRETDGIITFKVLGGGDRIDAVKATDATNVTATSFTANWEGRPEIPTYEVDLCVGLEIIPFRTVTVKTGHSYTFTGLNPSTLYHYTVRAVDGDKKSLDSNDIKVTTAEPTFDMLPATALPATEVYGTQFTANWEALADAESYEIDVYSKDIIDPVVTTVDFTKVGDDLIPEDWYSNCTSTDSRSGYFGKARPSLKMAQTGAQISSPVSTDDVNFLRFWYRGNNSTENASIIIDGLKDMAWQNIHTINPIISTAGQTVEIGGDSDINMPVGIKSVRILFRTTDTSSLNIDDIEIGCGGAYVPVYVNPYDHYNVGATTMTTIEGLTPSTTYYYIVRGVNDDLRSLPSKEISVTTNQSTEISLIASDSESGITLIPTADGVQVTNAGNTDATISCTLPSGATVFRATVHAGATHEVKLPANAIYIVNCGDAVLKLAR